MTPFFYNAGKALAEVAGSKQTNELLDWLAGLCRVAALPNFLEFCLILSAALLFLPTLAWLRGWPLGGKTLVDLFRLPDVSDASWRSWATQQHLRQVVVGFFLMVMPLLLWAGLLGSLGILAWKNPSGNAESLGWAAFGFAGICVFFQEVFFRGFAQGCFERVAPERVALGLSSAFFALIHFLKIPEGMNVVDPDASGVGLELLQLRFAQLMTFRGCFVEFMPWFVLGLILAFARLRSGSLGLSFGLYLGWVLLGDFFENLIRSGLVPLSCWLGGPRLSQGLLPLVGLLGVGWLLFYLSPEMEGADEPES